MSRKKNIVFIIADSLRYDSILQGDDYLLPYTSANATVFTQARSSGSWTLPATASMFSGKSLHEHGATSQTRMVNSDTELLAERLKREGYRTIQVTANSATTHIFGLNRGFDKVEKIWELVPRRHRTFDSLLSIVARPRLRKHFFQNSKDLITEKFSEEIMSATSWMQSNMDAQFQMAEQYLEETKKNQDSKQPIFLFINLMESHFPYHIADTFTTSLDNPIQKVREVISLFHFINQSRLTGKEKITPAMLKVLRQRQRTAWSVMAERLDNFIQKVHGDNDNFVMFASDHGDNFGEQEKWQYHFSNVNDAGNRTALFILPAGKKSGKIIDEPISMRHVHGTIFANAGIPIQRHEIDLLKNAHRSVPLLESFWYDKGGKTAPRYHYNQFAFLHEDHKYVCRNGNWLNSRVSLSGHPQESEFIPLDKGINPIEEISLEGETKKEISESFKNFETFHKKIKL